ncbi:putative porin [Rheinheimera sp. FR7-31]|uniref:putative porin n=1 Tax=Rheinheimera fenheensis TaxID=3152295 RepID=UPI00325EAAA5
MKTTMLASVIAVFSASALANSYQHQSDASFGWGDVATGELQNWSLRHEFYLTPVRSGTVPYAEAAFISRNASVFAGYDYTKFDLPSVAEFSFSNWQLGGVYQDKAHNFYAAAAVSEVNGNDDRQLDISLGYFVASDWLVKLDARNIDNEGQGSYTEYGISTKKLLALEKGNFINIEASFMDVKGNDISEYSVAADYYFGRNIAVGLVYDWLSDDLVNAEEDSFTLRGSWFLQPNLALKAAVAFDNYVTQDELYQLGISYRF